MATENRLIDANALKETVITDYYEHFTRYHDTDQIALIDMVCDDIDETSTVDAVEVVHGRWIPSKSMALSDKCSVCHGWVTRHSVNERKFNYCPNCGAKMDGDGNG